MSLPWNRGGPEDSSDSLLDRLPFVPGGSRSDTGAGPERSEPRRVAAPEGAGSDDRDAPDGRSDGDPLIDVAEPSQSPGGESPEPVDRKAADGEVPVRR